MRFDIPLQSASVISKHGVRAISPPLDGKGGLGVPQRLGSFSRRSSPWTGMLRPSAEACWPCYGWAGTKAGVAMWILRWVERVFQNAEWKLSLYNLLFGQGGLMVGGSAVAVWVVHMTETLNAYAPASYFVAALGTALAIYIMNALRVYAALMGSLSVRAPLQGMALGLRTAHFAIAASICSHSWSPRRSILCLQPTTGVA